MTIRFSSAFKKDLLEAESHYSEVSPKLGDDFHERVKEAVQTISARGGGDHIGPHGFRGRKCRPFPYVIYYELDGDQLFILGLVQERRHPDYLRNELARSAEK